MKICIPRSRWLVFVHDCLWLPAAVWLAFLLRFNLGVIPAVHLHAMQVLMAIALPVQAAMYWYFGLYRGVWRYASLPDLLRIAKAVLLGAVISFVLMFIWQRLEGLPRSVPVLYPLLLILFLTGPRLLYRWATDHHLYLEREPRTRALIVGAGRAGEMLVRDLLKSGDYHPVAFLDDARDLQGQEIHGVRVVGTLAQLDQIVRAYDIEVVLLAIPSASHRLLRTLVQACQRIGIPCRTLPSVADIADGRVELSQLRKVRIEDLLGREVITLDQAGIERLFTSKCVLVTGAGGSIGSELCRQIVRHRPARLIMLDHAEYNLYAIERELYGLKTDVERVAVLGDIRDRTRMQWLFEQYAPDIVFNAAAYKHVPLVEHNPAEGVKTNVLGTCQLADLACAQGVGVFVQISTDKAVNPTNVMGASKRAAEIYCQNLDSRCPETAFITTRFGNVLGSAGSVVPLFEQQIRAGGPVTVTHPEITRYFMTIPEAVSLILQAASMGNGGEIFVLDMGEPVRIVDLAEQMIRLAGLEPGRDIEIVFTGLRPGEKLHEELFHGEEKLQDTSHPKIMQASSRVVPWQEIRACLDELTGACNARDVHRLRRVLRRMVPEYAPMEAS
ncbi:MAG: polysaccharide biosynthesis protein [Zetaproteobacteria bacterium]|nr:MAG: polysaccharide biosynthesis protein [Zetaproteobacteria bacterium]